jgi:Arc/MetJ family transcription regulator
MRTNIEINDRLMADALAVSGRTTKRAVVEDALRLLIQVKQQTALLGLYGKVNWQGDLEAMRRDA